ncbi:mediator of RNA polymerase II transcription subunit 31 [Chlorella sorokiniana]|uniref:Mediator of RNA polymerase II transcription subunit 31 n=1 Tax=Chlorella sorokiniana TaxID=3076 RepID=A0A2P6TGR1_CHLSO|nr:mediator of RNA polymerase II transcription subunit 31 [Chlorella sorokiniana]|eukprot:PRW33303.1 mediator of RNA polymerase II transcription subunit 31 [Chlorella sorokiniana]
MAEPAEPRRADEEEVGCSGMRRFELELEFLHCLANPGYLNWLAQNRYFEDEAFLEYLKYLLYWRQPQYARFIVYPHALYFLDLLQTPEFRAKIANPAYKEMVHTQQFFFWQYARANRIKEKVAEDVAAAGAAAAGGQQAIAVKQEPLLPG